MAEAHEQRAARVVEAPQYAYHLEEEPDLRHYVNILIRYKWWVIAPPVVAVIVAAILGYVVMQKQYTATALVAVTSPTYILQLSAEFETVPLSDRQLPVKAYPTLATSADLLQDLLTRVGDLLPEEDRTLRRLTGMVSAQSGLDTSVIELSVTHTDPGVAAAIANAWADLLAVRIQSVYGQSDTEVSTFATQLGLAEERRNAAEEAMIEFRARSPIASLQALTADQKAALADYLSTQRAIDRTIGDARSLRERLSARPPGSATTYTDELSSLLVQLSSLSTSAPTTATGTGDLSYSLSSRLQLQLELGSLMSDSTVQDQVGYLDDLVATLEAASAEIDVKVAAIQEEMLSLQRDLEDAYTEENRLSEERSIARDLYRSLSLKLEEARIDEDTNSREVQVAARAVAPTRPSAPRKTLMMAVAGAVGLMIGLFAAFTVHFFRSAPKPVSD